MIRAFFNGLIFGIVLTVVVAVLIGSHRAAPSREEITVKGVSGSTAKVESFETTKKSVDIKTSYDAKGESVISVPLSRIPEADAWLNKTTTIQVLMGSSKTLYGSVWRRWDCFSVGGGFRAPFTDPIKRRGDFEILFGTGVSL
jgi:hypothetical protein